MCRVLFLLVAFPGAATAQAPPADGYLSYSGIATARHSSEFLYEEHHVLRYQDGRPAEEVVLYTCRSGSPFARKTVTYVDPLAPDFQLEDAGNGMREGVRSRGNGREVFFRGVGAQPQTAAALPQVRALVVDTGFDAFIRANWQILMTGKPLALPFLVPSRLEAMSFAAQRVRGDELDGIPVEVLRLKLTGVLGWVLPGIDVSYSAGAHVLMRYEGLSDLRDASGDNFQTTIMFRPSERKAADGGQMSAARHVSLSPCK